MSKHFYQFKGEQFEIPTYEEIRDRLLSQAEEPDRDFLDRLALKRNAEAIDHYLDWKNRRKHTAAETN